MALFWTLSAIFLLFSLGFKPTRGSTGPQGLRFQQKEEPDGTDTINYNLRSSMIQFIVHKGCEYVSAYVLSRYTLRYSHFDHAHTDLAPPPEQDNNLPHFGRRFIISSHCSWKDPVTRLLNSAHVPHELVDALIDCGPAYSFKAIGITDWYHAYSHCNITATDHDHQNVVITGKRGTGTTHVISPEGTNTRLQSSNIERLEVARRVGVSRPASVLGPSGQSGSAGRNQPNITEWFASDKVIQSDGLTRWCSFYEKIINRKFHLGSKRFQHTSPQWLVDVYRMAKKFHTPKSYIHGLVGCGKEYALDAFAVPDSIAVLYTDD